MTIQKVRERSAPRFFRANKKGLHNVQPLDISSNMAPPAPSTEVVFPDIDGVGNLGAEILKLVGKGELTVEEGRSIVDILAVQARLREHDELAARITAPEGAANDS